MSKWYAIYNGQKINYFVGIAIAYDQFMGAFIPRADIDRTISHRLGLKKLKKAVKRGYIDPVVVRQVLSGGKILVHPTVYKRIQEIRLGGLPGLIDRALDKIDPGHSLKSVGFLRQR